MEFSTTPKRYGFLTLLSLVGAGLGISLTQHYYTLRSGAGAFKSFCNLGGSVNCDVVTLSRFSEFFPGFPLSSFVTGWFIAFFILSLVARNVFWRREVLRALFLMAIIGTAFSLVYFALMAFVIKSYCLFCLITDLINIALLGIVISLKPEGTREHKPEMPKWKTILILLSVTLVVTAAGLKGFDSEKISIATEAELFKHVADSPEMNMGDLSGLPYIGAAQAPIQIVEYSDFQCPFCRGGALTMNNLVNKYPGKVKVYFRNFPLNSSCNRASQSTIHPFACDAAKAVYCANQQGKFIPLYERLFENQSEISPGKIQNWAQELGINTEALQACMNAPETQTALMKDTEAGEVLGVRSTPTFFFNGRKVEGAYPLSVWVMLVEHFLKK